MKDIKEDELLRMAELITTEIDKLVLKDQKEERERISKLPKDEQAKLREELAKRGDIVLDILRFIDDYDNNCDRINNSLKEESGSIKTKRFMTGGNRVHLIDKIKDKFFEK